LKLYAKNTKIGLIPLYSEDLIEKKRLKLNEVYAVEVTFERNYMLHKKFFKMVQVGHNNTKLDMPFEAYRDYVTIKAGFANIYKTPKGIFVQAQSISFASMNQEKFEEVYQRVLDVVIKDIGINKEVIENQLMSFL
jgi:ribosomal protein L9